MSYPAHVLATETLADAAPTLSLFCRRGAAVPEDRRGPAPAPPARPVHRCLVPALEQFLGSSAGLSPATVTRLTAQGQADHAAFRDGEARWRAVSGARLVHLVRAGAHSEHGLLIERAEAHAA